MKRHWLCEQPAVLAEAAKAGRTFHPVWTILLYLLLTVPVFQCLRHVVDGFKSADFVTGIVLILLSRDVYAVLVAALLVLFAVSVEKRSLASLGLVKDRAYRRFIILSLSFAGAVVALGAMMTLTYYQMEPQTALKDGLPHTANLPLILIGEIVAAAGMCVHVFGWLFVSLANRMKLKYAILCVCVLLPIVYSIIDICFQASTGFDTHEVVLYTVVYIFVRLLIALIFLRTSSIWPVAGVAAIYYIFFDIALMTNKHLTVISLLLLAVAVAVLAVIFIPKKNGPQGVNTQYDD